MSTMRFDSTELSSEKLPAKLRRSGGSIILSIPKTIIALMDVDVGGDVLLSLRGRVLEVQPAKKSLAERLAMSPQSPEDWHRDGLTTDDELAGRELL